MDRGEIRKAITESMCKIDYALWSQMLLDTTVSHRWGVIVYNSLLVDIVERGNEVMGPLSNNIEAGLIHDRTH